MKRSIPTAKNFPAFARSDDLNVNLTNEQLAAIGSIAMNYNEMEGYIDILLWHACALPLNLILEVSTRINGIDGKLAIIKKGARHLGLNDSEMRQLEDVLGRNWFEKLKSLRNAVIHARIFNVPLGVGIGLGSKASIHEVLISLEALQALNQHITAVRLALNEAASVLMAAKYLKDCASDYPDRAPREATLRACKARFQARLDARSTLPPLPELPSEQEMNLAGNEWIKAQIEAHVAKR